MEWSMFRCMDVQVVFWLDVNRPRLRGLARARFVDEVLIV